jgi:peptidoglycan/xylan/chitin deacetylase (PgdA/CDA1 family)
LNRLVRTAGSAVAITNLFLGRGFLKRHGLTIIGWHRIGDSPDGLTTRLRDFEAQLDYLSAQRANVLPLAEAVDRLGARTLPPRAVSLTFDDGYASVVTDAWPALKRHNYPATLFVVPGYLKEPRLFPWDIPGRDSRLLTSPEVQAAFADGLDIGSHTMEHHWLPQGSSVQVLDDLTRSRRDLEELLGSDVAGLAYPTGGWDQRVRDLAAQAGYHYAVTVDRGTNFAPASQRLSLRRSFAPDSIDDFALLLDGGFDYLRPLDRMRRTMTRPAGVATGW